MILYMRGTGTSVFIASDFACRSMNLSSSFLTDTVSHAGGTLWGLFLRQTDFQRAVGSLHLTGHPLASQKGPCSGLAEMP